VIWGTVTHLLTLPQSIVSGQEDAYYTLTVPTEGDSRQAAMK